MTQLQEKAINRIKRLVESDMYTDNQEIKTWEVTDCDSFVSLVVEYGYKGDEGTLASIICRTRAHLFIGKRGGITYPVTTKNGKFVRRQFGGYSILQAALDQKY